MNKIFLIGNLTKDPEIRMTSTGKKVASFSMAINDGKDASGQDVTQYFNLNAWDKKADLLELYVKKGHKIAIVGKLQNRSWDGPDGTKKYATDVVVSDLELLTSRAESERLNHGASSSSASTPESKTSSYTTKTPVQEVPEINIDDIDLGSQMPF